MRRSFVRPSGTEDIVRVYAEAESQERGRALNRSRFLPEQKYLFPTPLSIPSSIWDMAFVCMNSRPSLGVRLQSSQEVCSALVSSVRHAVRGLHACVFWRVEKMAALALMDN